MYGLLAVGRTQYNFDLSRKYTRVTLSKNILKHVRDILGYQYQTADNVLEHYLNSLLSASVDLYGDDLYNDLIVKVGDSKGVNKDYYQDIKLAI